MYEEPSYDMENKLEHMRDQEAMEIERIAEEYRGSREWFDVSRWDDEATMDAFVKISMIIDSDEDELTKVIDIKDVIEDMLYDTSIQHAERCMKNR
jgi:hypothetical protein